MGETSMTPAHHGMAWHQLMAVNPLATSVQSLSYTSLISFPRCSRLFFVVLCSNLAHFLRATYPVGWVRDGDHDRAARSVY
jgi:hypothetical protein